MSLLALVSSHSMLRYLTGPAATTARSVALRDKHDLASVRHRCFPSYTLHVCASTCAESNTHNTRQQLSKRFTHNFINSPSTTSKIFSNSLFEVKVPSEGSTCLQKLSWCSSFTSRGNGFQTAFGGRFFSSSSIVNSEAVTKMDISNQPGDADLLHRPELENSPTSPGKTVSGTTKISSDPTKLSSLYVPRYSRDKYASVLTPHLSFDKVFADVENLANDLQKREGFGAFTVDKLNALKEGWQQFKKLKSEVEEIEEEEFEITKQRKIFIEKMKSAGRELAGKEEESFDRLGVDLVAVRKKMRSMTTQLNEFEETVVPDLLRFPNTIDKTTPLLEDKVLFSLLDPPKFGFLARTHTDLGALNQTLELSDVAPGAFYLLGDLAQAELALQDLIKDQIGTCFKYLQHANPDFGNGVTVEGCGYDIHDPSEVLDLMAQSVDGGSKEFLTGGASLPSFAGYFAKKAVTKTKKFLPQKLFAIGRLYTPRKMLDTQETHVPGSVPQDSDSKSPDRENSVAEERPGILSSMQSTSVSAFVADTKESNSEENVVNELLAVATAVYAKLGLHFRIVQRNAKSLKPFEKAAYSIEMATTSYRTLENTSRDSQSSVNPISETIQSSESATDPESHKKRSKSLSATYTEIGRISVIGDYVSKRLLMLYDKRDVLGGVPNKKGVSSTRYGLLNVVFAEVMNVSKFLAVMVENTQTEAGGYEIPAALREYPVMTGTGSGAKMN